MYEGKSRVVLVCLGSEVYYEPQVLRRDPYMKGCELAWEADKKFSTLEDALAYLHVFKEDVVWEEDY